MTQQPPQTPFDRSTITRPEPVLWTYYLIISAFTLIGFPIVALVHYFKYHTLRYRFDDEGVSMSWGLLFRREIHLTYRRMQDIHLTRNFIQRWLGLADIGIQTASGSSGAEMTIEGITQPERLRDFLYARMRGASDDKTESDESSQEQDGADEALELLREIRDELRRKAGS